MRKPKNWFQKNKRNRAMNEELKDQKIDEKAEEKTEKTQAESPEKEAAQTAENEAANSTEESDNQEESPITDLDSALEAIARLQVELRDTRQQLEEEKGQVLRLNADFINFRNRKTKEVGDAVRFANQDLLLALLPILDDFDRTLSSIEKTDNLSAVKKGIELVNNSMRKRFGKIGLEPIEAVGKTFDSEIHEAITTVPVEEEEKKGTVIDEIEKGYRLKERVIRFSKVVVGE
jgi:molecular chaperone GrpE